MAAPTPAARVPAEGRASRLEEWQEARQINGPPAVDPATDAGVENFAAARETPRGRPGCGRDQTMRRLSVLFVFVLALASAGAQQKDAPAIALPYTPSLDLASMDRSADPCVDFYQYSCGGWMKNNPIPSDQASWSVYGKLFYDNQRFLWGLLEEAANTNRARTASEQKIGDYFSACMDEPAIERAG